MENKKNTIIITLLISLLLVGSIGLFSTLFKHQHVYKEEIVNATCYYSGLKTYTCSCGDNIVKEIPKLNHDFFRYEKINASASNDGINEHYRCLNCNNYFIFKSNSYYKTNYNDLVIPRFYEVNSNHLYYSSVDSSNLISSEIVYENENNIINNGTTLKLIYGNDSEFIAQKIEFDLQINNFANDSFEFLFNTTSGVINLSYRIAFSNNALSLDHYSMRNHAYYNVDLVNYNINNNDIYHFKLLQCNGKTLININNQNIFSFVSKTIPFECGMFGFNSTTCKYSIYNLIHSNYGNDSYSFENIFPIIKTIK